MAQYERIPLEDFEKVFLSTSIELSSSALNGLVTSVSDEFFAEAQQMLEVGPAPSLKGQFGPKGALFSGWESRRHNPAFDWCIIKLGAPSGNIVGFDIDTAHFNGNEAPEASVEACVVEPGQPHPISDDNRWEEILPKVALGPSSRHLFKIPENSTAYTHVKLNMYPDGGIARFRVYGLVTPIFPSDPRAELDLAHVLSGGRAVKVSDQHFGVGSNLLLPGRGKDMGDGWETKRSRTPGHTDWVIIRLGAPGYLNSVEIDTIHFIGNYPESCTIHGLNSPKEVPDASDALWTLILPRTKLSPNRKHAFQLETQPGSVYTHLKVTIYPDGGIKRIRVLGHLASPTHDITSAGKGAPSTVESTAQEDRAQIDVVLPSHGPPPTQHAIPALPLTPEAFASFGDVIQAWNSELSAPRGIKVTSANQGTAYKFHKISSVQSSYPKEGGMAENAGLPGVSVFRCTPLSALEGKDILDVRLLERHLHTNQIFIPMGTGAIHGHEDHRLPEPGNAYMVIVAQNGKDDRPDLTTLRAFKASTSQGIAYNTGIWHHPMIALEKTIDFTCIETQTTIPNNVLDCEILEVQNLTPDKSVPQVRLKGI